MTGEWPTGSSLARGFRALGVLAAVAVTGPPIGGLLVFSCVYPALRLLGWDPAAITTAPGQSADVSLKALAESLGLFMAMGYGFGGMQAVLTALWAAWSAWRLGTVSRRGMTLAALGASAIWIAILYSPLSPIIEGNASDDGKATGAAAIAIAVTPIAVVCALFTRWLCVKLRLISDRIAN
jgi:hypothetical protein